jgi:hypothetical protein
MGQLPPSLVCLCRPFKIAGQDYGGPILLKTGGRRSKISVKAFTALFVCMVTKAIHIELVSDLPTDSFLAVLKRLTSRRGKCNVIHSDKELLLWELMICDDFLPMKVYGENLRLFSKRGY